MSKILVCLTFLVNCLCYGQSSLAPDPKVSVNKPQKSTPKNNKKPSGAQIAVVVNKEVITYQDLYDRIALVTMSSGVNEKNVDEEKAIFRQVLHSLVQERIRLQVCKELKIYVSDAEINEALSGLAKDNNMTLEQMRIFFKSKNVNIKTLEERLRSQLGWVKAVREVFGSLVHVSEKEAQDALDQSKKDQDKLQYELMEIVLYVGDKSSDTNVKNDIHKIYHDLKAGAPFRALAQNFSQSTSASNGGYLGWSAKGQRNATDEEALEKVQPGQFTQPLPFNGGYRILLLKDVKKPGQAPTRETLITYYLMHIPYNDNIANVEKELIQYRVKELHESVTDCDQFKAKAKDWGYTVDEPEKTKYADLPDALEKLFLDAKVGQPLAPIRSGEHITIPILCRRESPKTIKLPTLDEITNQQYLQKLERMATREFNKLMTIAHVDDRTTKS